MLGTLARRIANLAFGGGCYLCRGAARGVLCAACDADLPRLAGPACPRCALATHDGALCGRCLARPPAYDATVAALAYAFPADVLVQGLKFRGELALAPQLAERSRDTPPQVDLPLDERARNVRGAFRCAQALERAEIAVVDDVMTTGATLDELAATLKRAGAARVVNWVVARTPPPADA